jgi:hypothetical protein
MRERPVVLMLVTNADQRETVRRQLNEFDVVPIAVSADDAIQALSVYRPVSVILDEAHAAVAPDAFLEAVCARHVRLVTLPESSPVTDASQAAVQNAAAPRAEF